MERKLMLEHMYCKTTRRAWTSSLAEWLRPVNGGHSVAIDQQRWSKQRLKWNHSEVTHPPPVGWTLSATQGWSTAAVAWKGDKRWHTKKMASCRKSFQEQPSLPLIKLDQPALFSRRCVLRKYLWGNPTHTFPLHDCSKCSAVLRVIKRLEERWREMLTVLPDM